MVAVIKNSAVWLTLKHLSERSHTQDELMGKGYIKQARLNNVLSELVRHGCIKRVRSLEITEAGLEMLRSAIVKREPRRRLTPDEIAQRRKRAMRRWQQRHQVPSEPQATEGMQTLMQGISTITMER